MDNVSLITFFSSIPIFFTGGFFLVKAQKMYMKRIRRTSGWTYPWDILNYNSAERKWFYAALLTAIAGFLIYAAGNPVNSGPVVKECLQTPRTGVSALNEQNQPY